MSDVQTDQIPTSGSARRVFPKALCAEDARALSAIQNWRGALAILFQWTVIATAAFAAIWSEYWLVYALAVVVIGTRQHALAILVHDAAHYRLFTGRGFNDVAANLTLSYPLGFSLTRYRPFHLDHHRFSYSDRRKDPEWRYIQNNPDWQWPKSPRAAARIILMDLLGLNILTLYRLLRQLSPWFIFFDAQADDGESLRTRERALLLGFAGTVLAALALTNGWAYFALLWLLPMATIATAVFRLRTVAEHAGLMEDHELRSTRTVLPAVFERFLVAPCNVNYHLEHHLYPSVPFYNLPKLHRRLLAEPEFRRNAHISRMYTDLKGGVIREVTQRD